MKKLISIFASAVLMLSSVMATGAVAAQEDFTALSYTGNGITLKSEEKIIPKGISISASLLGEEESTSLKDEIDAFAEDENDRPKKIAAYAYLINVENNNTEEEEIDFMSPVEIIADIPQGFDLGQKIYAIYKSSADESEFNAIFGNINESEGKIYISVASYLLADGREIAIY